MDFHAESVGSSVILCVDVITSSLNIRHSGSVKQRIIVRFVHIS